MHYDNILEDEVQDNFFTKNFELLISIGYHHYIKNPLISQTVVKKVENISNYFSSPKKNIGIKLSQINGDFENDFVPEILTDKKDDKNMIYQKEQSDLEQTFQKNLSRKKNKSFVKISVFKKEMKYNRRNVNSIPQDIFNEFQKIQSLPLISNEMLKEYSLN